MAVTMLTGVVDDNTILSNQKVIDMDKSIRQLEDSAAPLVKFLKSDGLTNRDAANQRVDWLEDELHPRLLTLASSYTSGTSITFASGHGAYLKPYDLIRNDITGENMLVTAVAGDVATVTRAVGAGTSTLNGVTSTNSSGSTDTFIRLANASAEGATIGQLKQTRKVSRFNFCQIVRTAFGVTNTLAATELYGGSEPGNEEKKKLIEHLREQEHLLFWGQRSIDTSGSTPRAYVGGLVDFIQTNKTTSAGTLTSKTWEDFLRTAFRYGGERKVFFCAPYIAQAISSFAQGRLAPPDPGLSKFGTAITAYKSALGFNVTLVPKLDWMDFGTASNQTGGTGFLVDMDAVIRRPLRGRDTSLLRNRQGNDEDSVKHEYLTEFSFQPIHERRHAILSGVTAYTTGVS